MDKFKTIEENNISKEVIGMVEVFLEGILLSVGKMLKHYTGFPANQEQTSLNCNTALHHMMFADILRILINRFPSLIIYVQEFIIPNEIIETYFKSFAPFYEKFLENQKSNPKGLGFIDFLLIANPYVPALVQTFNGILTNNNYFFKYSQIGENKILVSSSILWKYELLNKFLAEYQRLIDLNKIDSDLSVFNEFYHLILLLLNLLDRNRKSFLKNLWQLDEKICKDLLGKSLGLIKKYKDPKYIPLFKVNLVFITLFKKIYNRLIKLKIFSKKNAEFEKNDMKYYKFYTTKNISELLSRESENKFSCQFEESKIHFESLHLISDLKEYFSHISYQKSENPKYYDSMKDKILFSYTNSYDYYERLKNASETYLFSKPYENSTVSLATDWIDSAKDCNLFGDFKNSQNYNNGITKSYYSFCYCNAGLGSYYIDSSYCEKVYKNLNVSQVSLESLSEFINSLIKEAFPEEIKPNEDNKETKPEETKQEEEKK